MELIFFYALALVAVVASLLVVLQRNPVYAVLLLILSFGAFAGLYLLLSAPFVAVIQIIVYAGAIMVLFLFVIMLLNVGGEHAEGPMPRLGRRARATGLALIAVLLGELMYAAAGSLAPGSGAMPGAAESARLASVSEIGRALFTDYAFAFEVTSLLILVAMLGAVVLAKREY